MKSRGLKQERALTIHKVLFFINNLFIEKKKIQLKVDMYRQRWTIKIKGRHFNVKDKHEMCIYKS